MKRFFLLIVALVAVSCGPYIDAGTVVGKEYEPERTWYENVCMSYDYKNARCTFSMPQSRTDDEDWYVIIEATVDGKVVRNTKEVDQYMYDKCKVGRKYPDCDPG